MECLTKLPEELRGSARIDPDRKPTREECHAFFDMLRESGKTNMWGSPKYAEFYLDLTRKEARNAFFDWIGIVEARAKLTDLITPKD